MDLSAMLSDLKEHLARGEQLLVSHIPALVDLAGRIESDPLVQAAINLVVPESTRGMLVSLMKSVEADAAQIEQAAKASAEAPPAEPAEPAEGEPAQA